MKKIGVKNVNLKEVEQLSRDQLKSIFGGWSGSSNVSGEVAPACPTTFNCTHDGLVCSDSNNDCTCAWQGTTPETQYLACVTGM